MNSIYFNDSHVYPGCIARISFGISRGMNTKIVLAEFNDGTIADAEIAIIDPAEIMITISSYKTAKGSSILQKSWLLKYDNIIDSWKVASKL